MTTVSSATARYTDSSRKRLQDRVRITARRGRLIALLNAALWSATYILIGLLITALTDALFVLPAWARLTLLILLLASVICVELSRVRRKLHRDRVNRAAAEQIDRAAGDSQQPVSIGLSLQQPMDDDSLALALLQRSQQRAADVAQAIEPRQAYPLSSLRSRGIQIAQSIGIWLLLALIIPNQVQAVATRVSAPWVDAPPFSLTQLAPDWQPNPPEAGDDVTVSVEPTGLMPDSVDWVLLDERGNEAERFAMQSDGQERFQMHLKQVDAPIRFRLEAFGRQTRIHKITPTPRPASPVDPPKEQTDESSEDNSGETRFDPDKASRRDLEAHCNWPKIKTDTEKLLSELSEAQAAAQQLDPTDLEALKELANKLRELVSKAQSIAGEIAAMQDDLPTEASALLEQLLDALTNMQSAALSDQPEAAGDILGTDEPSHWLKQASDAAQADQQRIGQGLGPSDQPTGSGTASGQQGDGPDIRDPRASGTSSDINTSGDTGPLPDHVMQQVPPSYRPHVAAYFELLLEESNSP